MSQLLRMFVAAVLAGALLVGVVPAVAVAQEPAVPIDTAQVAELLFTAQVATRDSDVRGLKYLVLSAEFLQWRGLNPSATAQDASARLAARVQAVDSKLTAQDLELAEPDFALRVVNLLLTTPPSTAATSPLVLALVNAAVGHEVGPVDNREDLAMSALRTAQWIRAHGDAENAVWGAVRRTAVADAGFANAWNSVIGAAIGVDATTSFETLKADETLRTFIDVDGILARQGSRADFLAEALRQYNAAVTALQLEAQQAREQAAIMAATCAQTCTAEQRAAAEAHATAERKQIDTAGTASRFIADVMKLADLAQGEKAKKLAEAVYDVAKAVNKWYKKVGGRKLGDAIFSGATLALTGNVISAVMTIIGLFGESEPSIDQQILDHVVALRNEVRALGIAMQASFQQISRQLNQIYSDMMFQFDQLSAAVAENTARLQQLQNEVAEIGLRLEDLAAAILAAIGEGDLQTARSAVNQFIGYAENYPGRVMTDSEFVSASNAFHYAATTISSYGSFVVTDQAAGSDPATVLDSRGEASALSYLAQLAHARDASVPVPSSLLPNPAVWSFGAQAYMLLNLQNTTMQPDGPHRSDEIEAQGLRILDAAASFSRPAAVADASGNRTNGVFTSLTAEYRAAVARLSTALTNQRSSVVVRDVAGGYASCAPFTADRLCEYKLYDPFGPVTQPVPDSTLPAEPNSISKCTPTSSNPSISRPANANYESLPTQLRFAHYAYSPRLAEVAPEAAPDLTTCYDVAWTNVREATTARSDDTYARLRLTVRSRFAYAAPDSNPAVSGPETRRNARSLVYTWPEALIDRSCFGSPCTEVSKTVEQGLLDRWPRDKGIFEGSASASIDSVLATDVGKTMAAALQGRQRALYDRIVAALTNAGTPLATAAKDMNTAARQLQAYARLGFPIALSVDDLFAGALFGKFHIPVSSARDPQLASMFLQARNAYTCAQFSTSPAIPMGDPCPGGPYQPLANQPHLEVSTALGFTQPVNCLRPTTGVPGLPRDPLGNCLVASANQRLDTLAARVRFHSQRLADGVYVERLPFVATTVAALPVVDTLIRAQ